MGQGRQFSASGGGEGSRMKRTSPAGSFFGSQSSVSDKCKLVLCKLEH